MFRIRRRLEDSRKVAKLTRALALLDAQTAPPRPVQRRVARISVGS
jgi:hypothetical protein